MADDNDSHNESEFRQLNFMWNTNKAASRLNERLTRRMAVKIIFHFTYSRISFGAEFSLHLFFFFGSFYRKIAFGLLGAVTFVLFL